MLLWELRSFGFIKMSLEPNSLGSINYHMTQVSGKSNHRFVIHLSQRFAHMHAYPDFRIVTEEESLKDHHKRI